MGKRRSERRMSYQKKLEELSKNVGFTFEEVNKEYSKNLEVFKDEAKAWKQTKMYFARMKPRGNMKWYQTLVLSVREPFDAIDVRKRQILKQWQNAQDKKEELMKLVQSRIVEPDGTVLDWRPTIFKKPNPNFKTKPISGSDWRRHIYGLVSDDNFKTATFSRLSFQGEIAREKCPFEFFKTYKLLASRVDKSRFKEPLPFEVFRLGKSSLNAIEINVRVGLKDYTGGFIPVTAPERKGYCWVYGDVDSIRTTNGFSTFADLVLEEPSSAVGRSVTLAIPNYFPIAFQEGERLLSFGRITEYQNNIMQNTECYIPLDNPSIMNM